MISELLCVKPIFTNIFIDFSISNWYRQNGIQKQIDNTILPEWSVYKLRQDSGLSFYLKEAKCNISSTIKKSGMSFEQMYANIYPSML